MTYTVLFASLAATLLAPQDPPRDVTLCGRIVTPLHDGAPAAEVWVTDPDGAVIARTAADGEGYYMLRRLPQLPLRLHARGDGLAEAALEVAALGRDRAATLQLEAGQPLDGVVLQSDGNPAAGADVIAFDIENTRPDSPRNWAQRTVTDADGKWRLTAAPLRQLLVRAFVPGRPVAEIEVARAHREPITLRIPEGRIYERKVRIDGMPADQRVVLRNAPNGRIQRIEQLWPERMTSAVVAADGTATMWPLPIRHDLRIEAPGHRSYPLLVMCEAGNSAERRFALSPIPAAIASPSTTLRGRLVDALGQPLAGETLVGAIDDRRGPTARSAADGSFELQVPAREKVLCRIGLLSPHHQLAGIDCALANDGISWLTVAADPHTPLRLDAAPAVSLHCVVRTDDGAALLTTAIEFSWSGAGRSERVTVHSATDRQGQLRIEGLVPGPYRLTAVRQDGLRIRQSIVLDPAAPPGELVLPLPAGAELTGVVRGADGKPLASALFTMAHLRVIGGRGGMQPRPGRAQVDPESVRYMLCDAAGRFRVPHAAAGEWILSSSFLEIGPIMRAPELTITVELGRKNEVSFDLTR